MLSRRLQELPPPTLGGALGSGSAAGSPPGGADARPEPAGSLELRVPKEDLAEVQAVRRWSEIVLLSTLLLVSSIKAGIGGPCRNAGGGRGAVVG